MSDTSVTLSSGYYGFNMLKFHSYQIVDCDDLDIGYLLISKNCDKIILKTWHEMERAQEMIVESIAFMIENLYDGRQIEMLSNMGEDDISISHAHSFIDDITNRDIY